MNNTIGQRIRDRRLQLDLVLSDLAEKVGLSPSLLSYVERGIETPSLSSLARVAEVLRVPLAYFFLDGKSTSQVVRQNDRPTLQFAESTVKYQLLTRYPGRRLSCMVTQLPPGTSSFETPQRHDQEECVLLLQGVLEVVLGAETFILEEGDSIHFDGMIPHRYTAVGDEDAIYLMAISPLVL